jgi:YD repeat-containing protein
MIKYRYALDKEGNLIDITDLDRIELKKDERNFNSPKV